MGRRRSRDALVTAEAKDASFLARPGEVLDWRAVLRSDAVAGTGLIDALPGHAGELAERLGLRPDAVRVLLDALGAWDVVVSDPERGYVAGPACPPPGEAAAIRHHAGALRRWASSLEPALRGTPIDEDRGSVSSRTFLDALGARARRHAPELADRTLARFPGARRLLELGGGHGEYGLEFARRGLEVTMVDRPAVIEAVRERGAFASGGVELVGADFHAELPEGPFDVAFCAGVNHTFDGERNRSLLACLRPRLAEGGGVVIVTRLRGADPVAAIFAVQMLVNGHGGDTHGEDEYRAWLAAAGFAAPEVEILDGGRAILSAGLG